nr:nuclear pore complex protein NUP205-like [Tanacetum cinerariifolium]
MKMEIWIFRRIDQDQAKMARANLSIIRKEAQSILDMAWHASHVDLDRGFCIELRATCLRNIYDLALYGLVTWEKLEVEKLQKSYFEMKIQDRMIPIQSYDLDPSKTKTIPGGIAILTALV